MSRHRLNLAIRPNCTTHRLLFDGLRCIGVEVESSGEVFYVFGDEIVLSAGAIGSPHIFMLSGVGRRDNLAEFGIPLVYGLPGVGQNLRDHTAVHVRWEPEI